MKRTMKERLIALMCVIVMVCGMWYVTEPKTVEASTDEITTLEGLLEEGFTPWTFSDVGIEDQTIPTGSFNWSHPAADAKSMDYTIFHGKILFPAGSGDDFGRIFFGGSATETSVHNGFWICGHGTDSISLKFQNNGGSAIQIKNFYSSTAQATIRGNADLQFSLSTQIVSEQDGIATVKLGVFFNGKLYNDEYYTVSGVPTSVLTQHVKANYVGDNQPVIKSDPLIDITLENAPERDFVQWTFSDVGIADASAFSNAIHWSEFTSGSEAEGTALDETIFHGKLKLDNAVANSGIFLIGGNYQTEASGNRGFRFERYGTTDKIAFGFWGPSGVFYNENGNTGSGVISEDSQIAILDPAVAGTDLLGNSNLEMSLSVEYISEETAGNVDIRVGLFFDEKLYDNTYFVVKGVPESFLRQNIRFKMSSATSGVSNAIASARIEDITLENAPEKDFAEWRYSDLGVVDGSANWVNTTAISDSLDKTLFRGKIKFNTGETLIGGTGDTTTDSGTKWRGIRFCVTDTDKLYMGFCATGGRFFDANGDTNTTSWVPLVTFNKDTAGTDIVGNDNLDVAVSVEYFNTSDTVTDIKIGVFFNGILYNNTYYKVASVPIVYLHQNVVTQNVAAADITSISSTLAEQTTLINAPENDFTYWTFRDIDWSDRSVAENWGWATPSNTTELKNTIFNGKINFPTESTDFRFYIGGATTGDTSPYRGFFFRGNSGDGKLNLSFQGTDEKWYTETGAYAGSEAGAGPFLTMDSTTAGVDLRGNADLQVSLSIEYGEADENGLVDVKVGVFFDGVLYNNKYCTLKDVDPAYLTQNVRWLNGSSTTFAFKSLGKATNVAVVSNGASAFSSHTQIGAENTGYGTATLIDGIVGQNDPHYKGATGAALQNEAISVDIELGDAYSVDHVRMYNYIKEGGFPTDFTIEALTADGWKTVKTVNDYVAQRGWNDFRFADTSCTAVRVKTIANGATSDGYGFRLAEMQVYGVPTLDEVENAYTQAREGVVLIAGKGEAVANDGVLVGVHGHKVQADTARMQALFQTTVEVQSVQVHAQKPGKFASDIQIYAFDGSAWQQVYNNANYTYGTAQTMHEFILDNPTICTAVMVVATGLDELQIQEVRVHGPRSESEYAIFGDTNQDGDITEVVEFEHLQQVLVEKESASVHTDWNMDEETDVRDLVRLKRYFPLSEGIVRTYELSCMTWNILGFGSDGYEDQATRAPYIAQEILAQDMDFIGVQEAGGEVYSTITEYEKTLCENGPYKSLKISDIKEYQDNCTYYKLYGYMPAQSGLIIYYKADRFVLQNSGAIQYSVGQPTLTGDVERWFMYAEFLDTESGETVYMTNTHWSANLNDLEKEDFEAGATYHETQSKELMEYWQTKIGDGIMFATGDFNAYEDTEAIKYMNETGVYKEANLVLGELGSIKEHIDHIFVNPDKMDVKNFNIKLPTYTTEDGTTYNYSDHPLYTTEVTYKK